MAAPGGRLPAGAPLLFLGVEAAVADVVEATEGEGEAGAPPASDGSGLGADVCERLTGILEAAAARELAKLSRWRSRNDILGGRGRCGLEKNRRRR